MAVEKTWGNKILQVPDENDAHLAQIEQDLSLQGSLHQE